MCIRDSYRFIAGGIGITPILAMLEAAERAGNDWTLLYGGRTRASMAFAEDLAERHPERVTVWPQDERGLLDLESLFKNPEENTLVYCCGPEALLGAVSSTAPTGRRESFISKGSPPRRPPQRKPLKRSIGLRWCANVPASLSR